MTIIRAALAVALAVGIIALPLASEAQQATKEAPLFPPQSGHHPRDLHSRGRF